MSQLGSSIYTVAPGISWALIAHSALNHSGDSGTGASGILAASADLARIILAGGIDSLFIFPHETRDKPGLYLWTGTVEHEPELDCDGKIERLHPLCMQHWLDHNGRTP